MRKSEGDSTKSALGKDHLQLHLCSTGHAFAALRSCDMPTHTLESMGALAFLDGHAFRKGSSGPKDEG